MEFFANPSARRDPLQPEERRIVSLETAYTAWIEMQRWSGYAPTPLRSLRPLARQLRVKEISYKDESGRFSLGSFKALGGAYAAGCELRRRLCERFGIHASLAEVFGGRYPSQVKSFTLCCATDGNHGQSVAYAAQRIGCPCVVFMHEHGSRHKAAAIRRLGADVRRTTGTYDDSVTIARDAAAQDASWVLVADTSAEAFEQIPAEVIQGYGVMVHELLEQLQGSIHSHVFVQGGVGGLAASIAGGFADAFADRRPTLVVVEPMTAACLMESAKRGAAWHVSGNLQTNMEMLSCGVASPIAWTVLRGRADAFLTIPDEAAAVAVDTLVSGAAAGEAVDVGFSGAAGLAALIEVMKHRSVQERLHIAPDSHVLVFGTEAGNK